jgi:transglutaminase-like putative cysteine protease
MPVYSITHGSTYRYTHPVALSHQALHLEPLSTETQECLGFDLEVQPAPLDIATREDYFGNRVHYLTVTEPHIELRITARSQVALTPAPTAKSEIKVSQVRTWLRETNEPAANAARQFLYASPLTPALPFAKGLAQKLFADERAVLEGVYELSAEIHRRFVFDPTATHAATPMEEFIQIGRGVCQDFAHLTVSVVHAAGLPARYVSGYLLTRPSPGQARRIGADASHAWVSVFVPDCGWLDFDPTNDIPCGVEHITTARGRDYSDVSPVRGTVVGGGPQALFLGVTVVPAGEQS